MTYRDGVLTGAIATALVAGVAGSIWWFTTRPARQSAAPAAKAPAKVQQPLKEEQINTITLTPEAADRLKLQFAVVESKRVPRSRLFGGELAIPNGRSVVVQAPMSGMVQGPPSGVPQPGRPIRAGQIALLFQPLLTPEGRAQLASSRIEVEGQVKSAETQRDLARTARDRAQKVFESEAGSRRAVEEAQAQLDLMQRQLDAATARRAMLDRLLGEIERGTAASIPIESPADGTVRTLTALPGQRVPAGAPLFEVIDPSFLWVKVPVYAGELTEIDSDLPGMMGRLSARPDTYQRVTRAFAPPSANPLSATVDLFYAFDNRRNRFRPGERVAVRVPLKAETPSLTVPWSAIVYDIHGGTWVYERTGDNVFVRRRVQVRSVVGATAVLISGPPQGMRVVAAGAQELFGTETGFTK